MKVSQVLISALVAAVNINAAINEPCYGSGVVAGVCLSSSDCTKEGGKTSDGGCPADGANIKCCSKPECDSDGSSSSDGNCRWTSDCAGDTASNQCPGPGGFKCCSSKAVGFGGYNDDKPPKPLKVSPGCLQVAVDGAGKIAAGWPGRIREVFCERGCQCGSGSDHCCGKATDLMCSDGGGQATLSGREIAEWVMENRKSLKLSYVIWGQKIWNADRDNEMKWSKWRTMDDRNDLTQNHWDHVHVSYK